MEDWLESPTSSLDTVHYFIKEYRECGIIFRDFVSGKISRCGSDKRDRTKSLQRDLEETFHRTWPQCVYMSLSYRFERASV